MSAPLCGLDEYGNLEKVIDASSGMPIGAVFPFYGTTPPEHTMACNGAEISRTTYAELFAVIGTTAGEGDGSTTFNLPDLRGMFIRGTGGNAAELGVEQGDAIRNIEGECVALAAWTGIPILFNMSGALDLSTMSSQGDTLQGNQQQRAFHKITFNANSVVPTANENRPVNVALTYCIVYEN